MLFVPQLHPVRIIIIGLSNQTHAHVDEALQHGAMKIWWAGLAESLEGLDPHDWWQYEA